VRADLSHRLHCRSVQDDRYGRAALGSQLQEVPGNLVGVAGGRGDEQPQVSGREQLSGERAVALLDRVDVRRVEDGYTSGEAFGGDQLKRALVVRGVVGADQLRQEPVRTEPVGVRDVVDQNR
jgi:hypothetical protein